MAIEVWDTGIGIPEEECDAVFEAYHQLDNPARQSNRGLGLGLYIVRRLVELLGHRVSLHSVPGKGSVFSVEVARATENVAAPAKRTRDVSRTKALGVLRIKAAVLVVEDDPSLRELLELSLREAGCEAIAAADGAAALELVAQGRIRPDLLLVDYRLPHGMNGLRLASTLRESRPDLPVIVLTGDISSAAGHEIAAVDCLQINKPVKLPELIAAVRERLRRVPSGAPASSAPIATLRPPS